MLTLISVLSFLLPFQLGLHFDKQFFGFLSNTLNYSVYGFKIDYLIPTLYLTDIVSLLIIFSGIYKYKFKKRNILYILFSTIFIYLNIINSLLPISSIYKWLKIVEMFLLAIIILKNNKFKIFNHFLKPLSYSVFIVTTLGIAQYLKKGSLGGLFYILGERNFNFTDPNIAPYPYSTFSHPNSFAGFLLVFLLLMIPYYSNFSKKTFWPLLILITTNLILTNSLNVYITLFFIILINLLRDRAQSLLIVDLSQRFITHRLELIDSSFKIIKSNFWIGVGANNFIPNLVKVSNTFINSWELQPVHNIFLLVFTEFGFIGFTIFSLFLFSIYSFNNLPLIAIFVTGLSDHYWLTLQQNMLLFVYTIVVSIIWRKNT